MGSDGSSFDVSEFYGQFYELTTDSVSERLLLYKNVRQNVFCDDNEISLPDERDDYLHNFKTPYRKWFNKSFLNFHKN